MNYRSLRDTLPHCSLLNYFDFVRVNFVRVNFILYFVTRGWCRWVYPPEKPRPTLENKLQKM